MRGQEPPAAARAQGRAVVFGDAPLGLVGQCIAITAVAEGGQAHQQGLLRGDVLVAVGSWRVPFPAPGAGEVQCAIVDAGRPLLLKFHRYS